MIQLAMRVPWCVHIMYEIIRRVSCFRSLSWNHFTSVSMKRTIIFDFQVNTGIYTRAWETACKLKIYTNVMHTCKSEVLSDKDCLSLSMSWGSVQVSVIIFAKVTVLWTQKNPENQSPIKQRKKIVSRPIFFEKRKGHARAFFYKYRSYLILTSNYSCMNLYKNLWICNNCVWIQQMAAIKWKFLVLELVLVFLKRVGYSFL